MTTDFSDIANVYVELSGISKTLEKINFSSSILNNVFTPKISIPSPLETYPGMETLLNSYREALKASIDMSQYQSFINTLNSFLSDSAISVDSSNSIDGISLSDTAMNSDDSYVTLDQSIVKTYEFPETLAIPIGNNRFAIKFTVFLSILAIIISIFTYQKSSASSQEQTDLQKLEIHVLSEFLDNTKSSDSITSEKLDTLQKSVDELNTHLANIEKSQKQNGESENSESTSKQIQ